MINWQISAARRADCSAVLSLLHDAFAYMIGRIDPPSSLASLEIDDLCRLASNGEILIARGETEITGCAFAEARPPVLYLSKIAVAKAWQRCGIARALITAAGQSARQKGYTALELQTRIELTKNHTAFAALGFEKVGETAHPGFDRPTSVTMRKVL